jgi:hypothetical protein
MSSVNAALARSASLGLDGEGKCHKNLWYKIPGSPNPLKPRIPIHEHYGEFKPNLNVRRIIEKLLDSVDPEYLQGLGSIVLSSQTQLPRRGRRKKFLSRGRKHPVSSVLGFYHQSWKGQPASIELYVDKILAQAPGWWAHFPLVGFFLFAHVLFHELGHHLHKTRRPEFKEREDVAEGWEKKLTKIAFRKRYRRVMPFLRLLRPVLQTIRRRPETKPKTSIRPPRH